MVNEIVISRKALSGLLQDKLKRIPTKEEVDDFRDVLLSDEGQWLSDNLHYYLFKKV